MIGRRILVVVAVLMGLSALAASLSPPPRNPAPTPARSGPEAPDSLPLLETVSAERANQVVIARPGRRLRLEVSARRPTVVQLGQGGPIRTAQPTLPARFDLLAGATGGRDVIVVETRKVVARVEFRG